MGKYSALFMGAGVVDLITYTQRFPKPGETVSGRHFHKGSGGKGSNACVMSAKLGLSAGMVAKIGDDVFGRELIDNYKEYNINIDHIMTTKEVFTSTAAICVSDSGQNTIVYIPGPTNLLMASEISSQEMTLFKDCKLFVSTFECLPETLYEALTIARKQGVKTLINAAPPFPSAPADKLYPMCDIFCLNETEATITTGVDIKTTDDGIKACRSLLAKGCGSVILTLGSKGALYMDRANHFHVPIEEKVVAVDTTGAGDAFMGALAYYMVCHSSLSIQEQIRRSCFIATRTVLKEGTQSSYPNRQELPQSLFV